MDESFHEAMIERRLHPRLTYLLRHTPAVALLGPRQSGKTTLALEIAQQERSIYLDLEKETDCARLADPNRYLQYHEDKLVILDEVHRAPEIFRQLRGIIDRGRRGGRANGRFLLIGSAAMNLLHQSGETLAGRISYLELGPLDILETGASSMDTLWVRGGLPRSLLAEADDLSFEWRRDLIRTYLEHVIPQFGLRTPATTLRRLWTMLAHNQMQTLNIASLARGLDLDGKTVAGYLDLLVDLLVVRRLPAWHRDRGRRLVKSPRVYVRDSGLAHALLGIRDRENLLGHPVVGQTWQSFVIETLLANSPDGTEACYYRTTNGAEIDLVLSLPSGEIWAIEAGQSSLPRPEHGFVLACKDIRAHRRLLVHPGAERIHVNRTTEAIPLDELSGLLSQLR